MFQELKKKTQTTIGNLGCFLKIKKETEKPTFLIY